MPPVRKGTASLIVALVVTLGFGRGNLADGQPSPTITSRTDVYVATIDADTLAVTAAPSRVSSLPGSSAGSSWSPDGRLIAFSRDLPDDRRELVVQSVPGGVERQTRVTMANTGFSPRVSPPWFPDSRTLLISDRVNNRADFRRADIETAKSDSVLSAVSFPADTQIAPITALAPDGRTLYYTTAQGSSSQRRLFRLMKRTIETGRDEELFRHEGPGSWFNGLCISADGSRLAFSHHVEADQRGFVTISVDGTARREILRSHESHTSPWVGAWTKDGRHVLITGVVDTHQQIWAIPSNGGEPRKLNLIMPNIFALAVAPNGASLTFTTVTSRERVP